MTSEIGYLAHPEGDKCYRVWEDYEGHTVFVWARFHAEARRYGASALDLDWDSVECERYARLDSFEGDLLTWCLNDGWRFECTECQKHCSEADGYHLERRDIFCSKEHAEKFFVRWDEVKALEQRFAACAQRKFPELKVTRASVNVNGDGLIYFSGETGGGCRILDKSELL